MRQEFIFGFRSWQSILRYIHWQCVNEFHSVHQLNISINTLFQLLKPIYKGCMEKGIQQVSIQVAENALGPTTTTTTTHSRKSNSMQQNGKVRKRSWECANPFSTVLNQCKYRAQAYSRNLSKINSSNVSL